MSAVSTDDLLDLGADEVAELLTLTDAELAVVSTESVTPLPTLAAEPEQSLLDASAQGLLARGLLADDAGTLRVHPALSALLAARRQAGGYLLAEQQVATASQTVALYLHAEDRCLLEEVTPDGLHRFAAIASSSAVEDLAGWAAGEARDAELADESTTVSSLVELPLEDFERRAEELVGWAERVTVVGAVRPQRDDRRLTVYAAPHELVVAMPVPGTGLRIVRVNVTTLAGLLASMLLDREDA